MHEKLNFQRLKNAFRATRPATAKVANPPKTAKNFTIKGTGFFCTTSTYSYVGTGILSV